MELEKRIQNVEPFSLRETVSKSFIASGTFLKFNSLSLPIQDFYHGEAFREQFLPGSVELIDDVIATVGHDRNLILARVSSKTLDIQIGKDGCYCDVQIPETSYGKDLLISLQRQDIKGMSFTFQTVDDEFDVDKNNNLIRTVKKAKIFEVCFTCNPAYPSTTASVSKRAMSYKSNKSIKPVKLLSYVDFATNKKGK